MTDKLIALCRWLVAAISLFLLTQNMACAQPLFKLDDGYKKTTLPFSFIRNLIVVKIMINNKGPYNFVLDTGVGLMIITDPKLVDSLDIKSKRGIKVTGMGEGKDFEAYVVSSLKIKLDRINSDAVSAAILKKDEFGLSNYAGIPIHGLLGHDFFESFAVKVNFGDSTLTVGQPKDVRVFRNAEKLPLQIEEYKPFITTKIKINANSESKVNKLIVDLGAGHPLSLENLVGQNNGLPEKFVASNLGISLTGPIQGYLSRVDEIDIGKYKLKNVIASFPEYDTVKNKLLLVKRDGNIGMQILKRFNIIIDYQNGWLYLKPNAHFKEEFEQDLSGIEYYADGPELKHIIVSNVEKGSAAAEVGIQKGDEIVSINFKPVSKMSVGEIDGIFRSRPNRSILVEVFHDNQYDKVILVLRQRI